MNLHELCSRADFINKNGIILNDDCMNILPNIGSERERERERVIR